MVAVLMAMLTSGSTRTLPFAPVCRVGNNSCARGGIPWPCSSGGRAVASKKAAGAWQLAAGYTYALDMQLAAALGVFFARKTVIEFGAGEGCYTERLRASGVSLIGAFDGAPGIGDRTSGLVKPANLVENLTEAGVPRAHWILCLEVAEHIPRASEPMFLANLDEHASHGIILSWGQGWGNGHVNAQSPLYVIYRLSGLGFVKDEEETLALRRKIANSPFQWLPHDILVFRRHPVRARAVHAETLSSYTNSMRNPKPINASCITYQQASYRGAHNDGRLCGQCCGVPPDGSTAFEHVCRGSSWDGLLTDITRKEMEKRCTAETHCAGYYEWNVTAAPARHAPARRGFRPIYHKKAGAYLRKDPYIGWMKHAC